MIKPFIIYLMGIPLIKAGLTVLRLTLRPINNILIKRFKTSKKESPGFRFFVMCGNQANHFEINLNRWLLGTKGLGKIEDMHSDMAFNKGVEWFTEVVFFYGILFSIAGWELWKADASAKK
jgi:hypothetical protein